MAERLSVNLQNITFLLPTHEERKIRKVNKELSRVKYEVNLFYFMITKGTDGKDSKYTIHEILQGKT